MGIFSYHAICALQCGQNDRVGSLTDNPSGIRYTQTFKNDPTMAPTTNAVTPNITS